MSISSIYIMDKKLNILINRNYRMENESDTIEKFSKKLVSYSEEKQTPIMVDEDNNCVFIYKNYTNIIFLVVSH